MIQDGEMKLFQYGPNQWVTCDDVRRALREVCADQCKVLFLHTELSFGLRRRG